jgi:hypothetical protein
MARQFDVCHVAEANGRSRSRLAVVLQHDSLSELSTRVVAPLVVVGARYRINRATPAVELNGTRYLVATHLLATVPRQSLGEPIVNLRKKEHTLKNALDAVFFGI